MDRSPWHCATSAFVLLFACSGAPRMPGVPAEPGATRASSEAGPAADPNAERYSWEASTRSPQPLDTARGDSAPCGASDRALSRAAERVAAREAAGKQPLDTSEITFALRSGGAPYVWPRAWTLRGVHDTEARSAKLDEWLGALSGEGDKRCAVAQSTARDGHEVFAAVAVTALADLEPLPTQVPIGTWLDLRGVLLVPTQRVEVIVLGPRGRPHAVLASFSGGTVRSRFRADQRGTWLVQVLATTENGPRLAAEAWVSAGDAPPEVFDARAAPGEASVPPGAPPGDALLAMVNGARASEGLPGVRQDPRLDRLALEQAEAMREKKVLSHEASGTSLPERLQAIPLRSAGENVAHAMNLARAHRALWRSPSHRENLLHPSFELIGIGIAKDVDGSIWVSEIFAN